LGCGEGHELFFVFFRLLFFVIQNLILPMFVGSQNFLALFHPQGLFFLADPNGRVEISKFKEGGWHWLVEQLHPARFLDEGFFLGSLGLGVVRDRINQRPEIPLPDLPKIVPQGVGRLLVHFESFRNEFEFVPRRIHSLNLQDRVGKLEGRLLVASFLMKPGQRAENRRVSGVLGAQFFQEDPGVVGPVLLFVKVGQQQPCIVVVGVGRQK
jgi:hypothetical protein